MDDNDLRILQAVDHVGVCTGSDLRSNVAPRVHLTNIAATLRRLAADGLLDVVGTSEVSGRPTYDVSVVGQATLAVAGDLPPVGRMNATAAEIARWTAQNAAARAEWERW